MGKVTLYFTAGSMPSRACLLLLRTLNVDVEIKQVDLLEGEQHNESFLKINPVGKIPVLVDDGFTLSESRAILAYLVNSRKPGDKLYPTDAKKRAVIDQRLYYDATVVFPALVAIVRPSLYNKVTEVSQESKNNLIKILRILEGYLKGHNYFAGDDLTIADFSILPNITSVVEFGFDLSKELPNLDKWYKKMQSVPGFDENKAGAKLLADIMTKIIGTSVF
ncbi:hypothetical protein PVAND_003543 [Polypedilum vanderplanki]|uniref:glutathione transferase n=1 Tax=Polypedilum vanderplanki TaxID=319348 RepID=A0A9J6BVE2_POLVA|nr:hypothetical protein PVAND_003543 [Polypedilum vanderplanki]